MISPVPPQRWLSFSTSQGNPGPHKDIPLKHWPGLNLAGYCALRHCCSIIHPVQPQLLQGRGPTEICSSLSLLRTCRGVQPFCTSRQSPRQAEDSMGQWHLDQLNWSIWTGVFYGLSFEFNYSATQFRHKSMCIVGGERSFYKNTGTSKYKIVLPLPSQHYNHLQLKRNAYLLSSVIYIYLVKICYLTDFHIQPGKKKSHIHIC